MTGARRQNVFCPMRLIFEWFGDQGTVLPAEGSRVQLGHPSGRTPLNENARTEPGV